MLKQRFGYLLDHVKLFSTLLLLGCLFLLTTSSTLAGNNVWTTQGPYGGHIQALIIDPATPTTLYAGTTGGVYKSTDSGANWFSQNGGLTDTFVTALTIDPVTPNTLYAGTLLDGDIFKSTDGGNNWTVTSNGLTGASIRVLIVDPLTSNTLYAGTGDGVFKSTNGGVNWVSSSSGLTIANGIQALVIDPTNSNILYAGDIGVFKSTDAGASWTAINTGLTDLNVRSLAIDPVTPTTVYMGSGKVFKSTNSGTSWSPTDTSMPGAVALAIDPATPTTLYAGNHQGVYKSTNGGAVWSPSKTGLNNLNVNDLVINPTTSSTLYVGTNGGGVYKSTNSGANWSPTNSGLLAIVIDSLDIDPLTPSILYAGSQDAGVYKSTDSGTSWSPVNTGLNTDEVYALAIDPNTPSTLYAGGLGIYKSNDGAANWFPINNGLTSFSIFTLAINPTTTTILYTGTSGGVFKSVDGGANWSPTNNGLTNLSISALAINPVTPTILYAATAAGVFKSTDSGANWFATNTGLSNLNVDALAIDPITPSNLYAGTYGSGVFKSTGSGANWFPINSGLSITHVNNLAINPVSPTILYVGGRFGQGISESKDGGQSWTAMNSGLSNLSIGGLVIDPINPINLYTGTASGVFDFQRYTDPYEPDNTSGQASWIISSVSQTHSIIPANDVDWVKFSLTAASEVVLEISGVSGDTRMWLYDSNLNQVDFDDDGGTNLFSKIDRLCGVDALAAGTYYVKIDEFGNNNEIASYNISLTTTACSIPILHVSPTNLDFNAIEGGSNPSSQSFNISNVGTGTLNWTASESLSWLSLDSTSGTAPATVNASVDISGLTAGTYNGQITVSSSGVQGSSQTVNVTLTIDSTDIDIDGDGLPDVWETNGVTIDPDGGGPLPPQFIDLPTMGANPDKPDIFLHVDWMEDASHSHKLDPVAIKLVVDAFATAPYVSPTGSLGINLHVDQGPTSILDFTTNATWGTLSRARALPHVNNLGTFNNSFYNWGAFDAIKNSPSGFMETGRGPIFHYVISAHNYGNGSSSGISRGIGGSDLIVSLGSFTEGVGSIMEQAGTLMHELGHNLGLRHGGDENINYKPNYLSVMNYMFQLRGVIKGGTNGIVDYSRSALADLNENSLNESIGLGTVAAGYGTRHFCNGFFVPISNAAAPIDWDCDGDTIDTGISSDINGSGSLQMLSSYDDWTNLQFKVGAIGAGANPNLPMETEPDLLTVEEAQKILPLSQSVYLPIILK